MHNNFIKKPSAIIFDFDDTLVDSSPIIRKALSATFEKFNIPEEVITVQNIDFNRSLRDYFHHIFSNNLKEAAEAYYAYYNEFSKELSILEDAEKVLALLNQNKVFMSIVSNKKGPILREEVIKFSWKHYFKSIIGSGDVEEDKPSIKPAIRSLEDAKLINYEDVWLIGDSLVDIQTAHNLGCKAIFFNSSLKSTDIEVYLSVSNHKELLKLLNNIYV